MKKSTFLPPYSAEREYTRLLLRFSRDMQRDVNELLIPKSPITMFPKKRYPIKQEPQSVIELRDYLNIHISHGRGDHIPMLDQRGLSFLTPDRFGFVSLSIPTDGDTHHDNKVFIRALF